MHLAMMQGTGDGVYGEAERLVEASLRSASSTTREER